MLRAILGGLVISAAVMGCSGATPSATLVGQVSERDTDSFCVASSEASGECFVRDASTKEVSVGDCVEVTYTEPADAPDGSDNLPVVSGWAIVVEATHPEACPGR